jgi:hypothetical protein
MTEEHIIDQMRTIISAGYETVSATIAVRYECILPVRANGFSIVDFIRASHTS